MTTTSTPVQPHQRTVELPPTVLVITATTVVGAGSGALVGPAAAALFGAVGLAWGAGIAFLAARLRRSEPRGRAWGTAAVFGTVLAAGALSGAGLEAQLVMTAAVDDNPQFFADLVRGSIGTAQALPFYLLNPALEWLLVPAMLLFGWRPGGPRRLVLAAFAIFYATRLWTYIYFVPRITDWGEGSAPLTAGQLDEARLWIQLSWVRLAADVTVCVLALLALLAMRRGSREPQG